MYIHCFCLSEEVMTACNHLSGLIDAEMFVGEGGLEFAGQAYQDAASPDLVIIETSEPKDVVLEGLSALAEHCDANTNVMLIHQSDDVALFESVTALGVSEFLVGQPKVEELKNKIDKLFSPPSFAATRNSKGVAFLGAHGGAGSSMLAHLFSWMSATQYNKSTIIADFDMAHGKSVKNFMISEVTSGIAEALLAGSDLRSKGLQKLMTPVVENLNLLTAPRDLNQAYDIPEDIVSPVMEALYEDTELVVFDLPNQWCAWTQAILSGVDDIVIVSDPTQMALDEAGRIYRMLKAACAENTSIHAVVNRAGVSRRKEIPQKFYDVRFGLTPVSRFTFEPALIEKSLRSGMFISELAKQAKFNKEMAKLTEAIHNLSLQAAKELNPASVGVPKVSTQAKSMPPAWASLKDKLMDFIFEPSGS